MKNRIAVEDSLTNVQQHLTENGYHVIDLNEDKLQDVKAVVITGIDEDMMNMSDINTDAPVIDARGLTAEEVMAEIEKIEKIRM